MYKWCDRGQLHGPGSALGNRATPPAPRRAGQARTSRPAHVAQGRTARAPPPAAARPRSRPQWPPKPTKARPCLIAAGLGVGQTGGRHPWVAPNASPGRRARHTATPFRSRTPTVPTDPGGDHRRHQNTTPPTTSDNGPNTNSEGISTTAYVAKTSVTVKEESRTSSRTTDTAASARWPPPATPNSAYATPTNNPIRRARVVFDAADGPRLVYIRLSMQSALPEDAALLRDRNKIVGNCT
jgi:hypothetical protein